MIDVDKGRYWDFGWQLISGCTPCSPGCDNCWSAAMSHRFMLEGEIGHRSGVLTDEHGRFDGTVIPQPARLDRPLKRKKPAVYAIWNDLFHKDVLNDFREEVFGMILSCPQHKFLLLTKRAEGMAKFFKTRPYIPQNTFLGLTVCNQQEAYEKLSDFKQIPGNKFLSLEPLLSDIPFLMLDQISGVIVGGETGPKARPMRPGWVRSIKDQCEQAGVPFFFKSWGKYVSLPSPDADLPGIGKIFTGRILDGVFHDDLPWVKP